MQGKCKILLSISPEHVENILNCKNKAIAYKLCNVKKYKKQKLLSDYGVRCAPQSFIRRSLC